MITGIVRREETIVRREATGDHWHMTWAANDRQYVGLVGGFAWSDVPRRGYITRMYAISGGPEDSRFEHLPGYPDMISDPAAPERPAYYGFGTIAVDGRIYQYLTTFSGRFSDSDLRFVGAKLIYSGDDGRTWHNQDGSTPVVWETFDDRTKDNMAFLFEPQDAFSYLSVLQMGRNYELNEDGYVYVYAPNGNTDGTMNELVMFRVRKERLGDRAAYEFNAGGDAWSPDIDARVPVCTYPRGFVTTARGMGDHPVSWSPSVAYNAALGVYMKANWGTGRGPDGAWFIEPSYLGFWVAPRPWGPWTQVHEEVAWLPNGDPAARAYQPQIAPKWIAPDGRSFWLVWSDLQMLNQERPASPGGLDPHFVFNAQRVDLLVDRA